MLFAVNDDGEPYAAPFAEESVLVRFDGKQSACPRVSGDGQGSGYVKMIKAQR